MDIKRRKTANHLIWQAGTRECLAIELKNDWNIIFLSVNQWINQDVDSIIGDPSVKSSQETTSCIYFALHKLQRSNLRSSKHQNCSNLFINFLPS